MSILGTKLKEIREKKGIPLEVIYHRSKIAVDNLKLIETNQFDKMPDAYLMAFLKSYAKEIGLSEAFIREGFKVKDNDELIELLFSGDEEQYREKSKTEKTNSSSFTEAKSENKQTEKKNFISETAESIFHRYKFHVLSGIIFILLVYIVVLLSSKEDDGSSSVKAMSFDQVVDSVMNTNQISKPATSENTKPENAKPKVINTILVKAPVESCYVQLTFPDSLGKSSIVDFIIPPTRAISRKAESFEVTIGRAQSSEVYLNGQKLTLPKTTGVISKWKVDESLLKK